MIKNWWCQVLILQQQQKMELTISDYKREEEECTIMKLGKYI